MYMLIVPLCYLNFLRFFYLHIHDIEPNFQTKLSIEIGHGIKDPKFDYFFLMLIAFFRAMKQLGGAAEEAPDWTVASLLSI